jgi:menaquinone-dependent protoporphyrinogen oxidase
MNRRVIVLFATREGQTRKIVDHIATELVGRGLEVDVYNVAEVESLPVLDGYAAAILAASLHLGRYEREMVNFVREHHDKLDRIPSTFLSVSLSEAGVENPAQTPEARWRSSRDVAQTIEAFLATTRWHPAHVKPVAGALVYTHYNPLVRFVMKQIARKAGASTDTSRDHEYTDWAALDRFAEELADEIIGEHVAVH